MRRLRLWAGVGLRVRGPAGAGGGGREADLGGGCDLGSDLGRGWREWLESWGRGDGGGGEVG